MVVAYLGGSSELGLCDDSFALCFQIEEEVVENLWGMLGLIQIGEVVHSNFGTMAYYKIVEESNTNEFFYSLVNNAGLLEHNRASMPLLEKDAHDARIIEVSSA
ncbi:hypothetical protein FEM48_Zijuj07G0035000 [Ziziphus jujuba var. spinosa]|uniref:Uncharacterized protein n=1 Tax=Ziziphus jujuba var. spinosa TaxID=714518 RepID=A0A978V273_ZIZJJ|nr:hypothetical protein FEM48_Zijuj07G0035000 [Ziziphus jujuba var. spinosa]